jgi:magnesium chelatase subunit I
MRGGPVPYPFAAIASQDEMKCALILAVIDPAIGGVLIMGHRGTAKSTAVRGLADLLPKLARVRGCAFGCDPLAREAWCADCRKRYRNGTRPPFHRVPAPVVDLPLAATEDRVCGSLNLQRALSEGVAVFEPGLLARAHRGFLYIDEVNLLEDHLVDLLLDVAASGRNIVEREGVSVAHPARFVLVGTGNPEEGELRPQLLDRFGLYVSAGTVTDVATRIEIVRRREEFERSPESFRAAAAVENARIGRRIGRARSLLREARMDDALLRRVAEICVRLAIEGHRGELTVMRAAVALAAYENRRCATGEDVRRVAAMALRHRLRRSPMDEVDSGARIERAVSEVLGPARLRAVAAGGG